MKTIIIFFFFQINIIYGIFCLPAKTIYGDCKSSDEKKWFKSKTIIDSDDDGKYDIEIIKWCNDKITTKPYKGSMISNPPIPFDPTIYSIHQLDSIFFTEDYTDCMFQFHIKDAEESPVIAIEYKELANDTIFTIIFSDLINPDNKENLKLIPTGYFNKDQKIYYFQYYQYDKISEIFVFNYPNTSHFHKVIKYDDGPGWKIRKINFNYCQVGNYFIRVEQNKISHSSEIFKVESKD